jgi:hypothetical protein
MPSPNLELDYESTKPPKCEWEAEDFVDKTFISSRGSQDSSRLHLLLFAVTINLIALGNVLDIYGAVPPETWA